MEIKDFHAFGRKTGRKKSEILPKGHRKVTYGVESLGAKRESNKENIQRANLASNHLCPVLRFSPVQLSTRKNLGGLHFRPWLFPALMAWEKCFEGPQRG